MKTILLLASVLVLTACGTTGSNKEYTERPKKQFCHTEQVIVKDSTGDKTDVQSKTVLTCSDKTDPMDSPLIKAGVSKKCGYFTDHMVLGGRDVWYKQIACFVGNEGTGRWVIVPNPVDN